MLNTCLFGDVREGLRQIKDAGIRPQTVVTSPPYFGLRDYGHPGQLGLERTPDEYIAAMVEVFALVRDVLADDGTLWLNIGDSYAANRGSGNSGIGAKQATNAGANLGKLVVPPGLKAKDLIGIPWMLAFALRADGWYLRQDIIWHKPNPMPESVRDRCTKAHEYLFLLSKSGRYYYDRTAVLEPFTTDPSENYPPRGSGRNKRSVWTVVTTPYRGAHFATFPPALVEPCILAGSRPGDIVLDPFLGSGTTAQVARVLGRNWVGCELNEAYRELQEQRIRKDYRRK